MNDQTIAYRPRRCVFEVTLACNMGCTHCGSRAGRPRADELTTAEVARTLEQLAGLGCPRVTLSGGEVMLRPDWLDLIAAGERAGLRVGLITNGLAFDRDAALAAKRAGLTAVGFSLDGAGRTHERLRRRPGLFTRVVAAMNVARDAGLPFSVVTQINRLNMGELEAIRDLVVERGGFAWQVQPTVAMGELCADPELALRPRDVPVVATAVARLIASTHLRIDAGDSLGYFGPEERTLRRSIGGGCFAGCHAGLTVVGIESNGNVKGCLSLQPGYCGGGARFVEGNVRKESLADIWNRPGAFAYNRQWSVDDLEGFCRTCAHVRRCRGGCRSVMVASGGGVENPLCVHRVLSERSARPRAVAAAAVLAAAMGTASAGCYSSAVPVYDAPDDDTSTETVPMYDDPHPDTDVDTDSDTDADTDTDTDTDSDTDTDTDTGTGPDTDTDTDTDTDADTDTGCVDEDEDWWCDPLDCDDSDPDVNPGADEIPDNDIDDDCDGFTDEPPIDTSPDTDTTSDIPLYDFAMDPEE